jgi:hypothetical protein
MIEKTGIERLEILVNADKKLANTEATLKDLRAELRDAKSELKRLNSLEPERLKKQLAERKKKLAQNTIDIKELDKKLAEARKQLRASVADLNDSQNERDQIHTSSCGRWKLFFTGFQFPNEKYDKDSARIRCLDSTSGTSVLANLIPSGDIEWSDDIGIPVAVTETAIIKMKAVGLYNV